MRVVSVLVATVALASACFAGPDIAKLRGSYELWEDFEGGKVCKVTLSPEQTIGGYLFEGDRRCMKAFKFGGDPHAWFVDREGWIAVVDAARKVLVRLKPIEDGGFYANRADDKLENLNLTR